MYVAALAQPLSAEYLLLEPEQYARAKGHPGGLYDFVLRTPGLDGDAVRFASVAALREHCRENGIEVAGDLHGCSGESGTPRTGSAPGSY